MVRSSIGVVLITAFGATAVFGLCAMASDMMTHDGRCASGQALMVCSANPVRQFVGSLLLPLIVILLAAETIAAVPDLGGVLAQSPPGTRLFALPLPPLAAALSDGILNPKTF